MSSRSREKIALVVFAGLIVLSLCGLGWYLLAGHSWNVAASNLDDTFGSMDGYTAIVYPGTAKEVLDAEEGEAPVAGTPGDEVDPLAKDADETGAPPSGASEAPQAEAPVEGAPEPTGAEEPPLEAPGAAGSEGSLTAEKKALDASVAKQSYEDKGATVFALDTTDLAAYREGVILKKDGHRFGVLSLEGPVSSIVLEKQIAYFKRCAVDFIVVVTPDKEYVDDVDGIDIVVSTQDEDLFVMGETIDGTFYVDAPAIGSVGAILISPSNVVSAKVLQGE